MRTPNHIRQAKHRAKRTHQFSELVAEIARLRRAIEGAPARKPKRAKPQRAEAQP